jgi:hypothetical protein
MLIYTSKITRRIQYIFQLIFKDIFDIDYEITENKEDFINSEQPKLNYSMQQFEDELFVESHGLLSQTEIVDQELTFFKWDDLLIFFPSTNKKTLPFDIFSASFYLVSRYEEYLPHFKDHYNRFKAEESIAYQNNFLEMPLVDLWANKLKKIIEESYPNLVFPTKKFKYISTVDIDNAYCFLEKGFARNVASFLKSIFHLDKQTFIKRYNVLIGKHKDPYDTYNYQLNVLKKYNLEFIYFILLGNYGLNDKNVLVTSRKFKLLIKHLSDFAQIGLHPSFNSNSSNHLLKIERDRLVDITKSELKNSRQHFLQLSLPTTYRNLIDLDIFNDYTMGYAELPGFRASICNPYYFYDLELEKSTLLKIHPFAIMDATFRYYLNYTPKESLDYMKSVIDQVKNVNGTLITVWHNETWSDYKEWKGWKFLFKDMVEYIHS